MKFIVKFNPYQRGTGLTSSYTVSIAPTEVHNYCLELYNKYHTEIDVNFIRGIIYVGESKWSSDV